MPASLFLGLALVAVVVFVGLDLRSPSFRASLSTDRFRLRRNVGYAFGNVLSLGGLAVVNGWLDPRVPRLVSWDGIPVVVEVIACVVVAELINWLSHWVKHVRPWLWTFHLQHHVGRHYDSTLTLHTHGVDVVVSGAVMSVVLMLLGFGKLGVDVFMLAYFVTNLYKHGHTMLSLGPVLDRIIVSPAYHRVHHTTDARGNYGSVLTLFDVLFGTAVWPPADIVTRPVGVDGVVERGFVDEMLLPVRDASAAG